MVTLSHHHLIIHLGSLCRVKYTTKSAYLLISDVLSHYRQTKCIMDTEPLNLLRKGRYIEWVSFFSRLQEGIWGFPSE